MSLVQKIIFVKLANALSISIHYMSLVQLIISYLQKNFTNFNTLYVVGSTRKNRASKILIYLKIGLQSDFSNHFKNFNNRLLNNL